MLLCIATSCSDGSLCRAGIRVFLGACTLACRTFPAAEVLWAAELDVDWSVVGSGFRGSVAAMRLAQKGYRVTVFKAGRRFEPENLPRTSWDVRRFWWAPSLGCYGIQRIDLLRHVTVLGGAGVGGGSLVYGNMTGEVLLNRPTTAHILGGCCMGRDPDEGAIDLENRAFGYQNLLVCDGSVIPANLGVNPALSITAFAERAMSFVPPKSAAGPRLFAFEHDWGVDRLLASGLTAQAHRR